MSPAWWSALLQYSRLAVGAGFFLVAARFLSLSEIGAFAAAFAPVRLMQVVLRHSLVDAITVSDKGEMAANEGAILAGVLGLAGSAVLLAASVPAPGPVGAILALLSPVPLLQGLGAAAEAALRRDLRLRALALRTVASQSMAAGLALAALGAGLGVLGLVVFAVTNAAATTIASVLVARIWPDRRPRIGEMRALWGTALRLSVRDLAGNATLPLLQIAVGAGLGLPAAGAFQIAARIAALVDALAVAPLRYVALPQLRAGVGTGMLPQAVLDGLRSAALSGGFACLAALAATAEIARIAAGPAHAAAVAPLLPGFLLLGLTGAVSMPLVQGLTATGAAWLTALRSMALLAVTLAVATPFLWHSVAAVSMTLPVAGAVVLVPFAGRAATRLGVHPRDLVFAALPPVAAGGTMAAGLLFAAPAMSGLSPVAGLLMKGLLGGGFFLSVTAALTQLPPRTVAR